MSKLSKRKRESVASFGVYEAERDLLDLYLHEVSKSPLLTPAQELEVARRVQQGAAAAVVVFVGERVPDPVEPGQGDGRPGPVAALDRRGWLPRRGRRGAAGGGRRGEGERGRRGVGGAVAQRGDGVQGRARAQAGGG